jgi:hypothetical protein
VRRGAARSEAPAPLRSSFIDAAAFDVI